MTALKNGLIFMLLSQLIWGITPLVIKFVPRTLPSTLLIATRALVASVILLFFIIANKKQFRELLKIPKKTLLQIVFLGLVATGLADLLMVQAIRSVGVILAVMIARLEIPLGVFMAGIMLGEKITPRIIMATVISFLGVLFVSYGDQVTIIHNSAFYIGIGVALVAAFLWAFSGVYAKKILTNNTSPVVLAFGRLLVGGIFNILLTYVMLGQIIPYYQTLHHVDWAMLAFLGLFSSALAFLFYYKGLEKIEASKSSILLSLSIVIAIISGLFIGEVLSLFQWAGIGAILVGIYLVTVTPKLSKTA